MFTKKVVMTTGGIRSFTPATNGSQPVKWLNKKKRDSVYQPTIGEDIELVTLDHTVKTDPHENRKRRTLEITKTEKQNWGFTVQSYGIQHTDTQTVDTLTYVDYVEVNGPAYLAGMMAGDVILSINGTSMEATGHTELIAYIRGCKDLMRVVVLFEDCCRKVELHLKLRKLKKLLAAKMFELNSLERKERNIIEGRKDSLSLHSASHLSLFNDSFCLVQDDDVFTDDTNHNFVPAGSYGSLPRNFSLSESRQEMDTGQSLKSGPVSSSPVQNPSSSSPVSSTEGSVDLNESCTSVISLNPRVDHRYTSLPPDMRRRSIHKSDRKIGNSLFYGEWLSENDQPRLEGSALSRDSGIYQTWTGGSKGSRSKIRTSTRSIGNSLFYVDSDNDEDISDTEEASVAALGGENRNHIKKMKSKTKATSDSAAASSDLENPSANQNLVVKLRSKKPHSPIRPVSLPNLQSSTLEAPASDSGIESAVFMDTDSTVSDWISSDSCDTRRQNNATSTEHHLAEGGKGETTGGKGVAKKTNFTGSVGLGAIKASGKGGPELSRSMGNLSNPEPRGKKSPSSPLFKSFVNWAPVKFTRSKIRHSLLRLRNRSSMYNVATNNGDGGENSDQFSRSSIHNAFSDIPAYATLPKRPKILKPNAKIKRSEEPSGGGVSEDDILSGSDMEESSSNVSGLYEEVMTVLKSPSCQTKEQDDIIRLNQQDSLTGSDGGNDYEAFVDVCKAFDEVELYSSTETLTGQNGLVCEDKGVTEPNRTLVRESGTKSRDQEVTKQCHKKTGEVIDLSVRNLPQDKTRDSHGLSNACSMSKNTSQTVNGSSPKDETQTGDLSNSQSLSNACSESKTPSQDIHTDLNSLRDQTQTKDVSESLSLSNTCSVSTNPSQTQTTTDFKKISRSSLSNTCSMSTNLSQTQTNDISESRSLSNTCGVSTNATQTVVPGDYDTTATEGDTPTSPVSDHTLISASTGAATITFTTSTTSPHSQSTSAYNIPQTTSALSKDKVASTLLQKSTKRDTSTARTKSTSVDPDGVKTDHTVSGEDKLSSKSLQKSTKRDTSTRTTSTPVDGGKTGHSLSRQDKLSLKLLQKSTETNRTRIKSKTAVDPDGAKTDPIRTRQSSLGFKDARRISVSTNDTPAPTTKVKPSRVEFFSRNLTAVYQEEQTGSQSCSTETNRHAVVAAVPGSSIQHVTSNMPKPGSPKRFVIRLRRPTGVGGAPGGSSVVQYSQYRSKGYKRRFYTYEEIPAMKSEYSLVNPESCETWL